MDLSKAFDTINHQLLVAKLYYYGFEKGALNLILNYLSNRWQRTKINTSFSSWSDITWSTARISARAFVIQHLHK